MDTATALDHARGFYARVVKPFERLPEILEAAVNAENLVREAERRLTALGAEEHSARNRLQSLSLQLPLLEADVDEARRHTTTTLDALTRQTTEATQAAQEVIREAEVSAAAKLAQLEADYQARFVVLQAENDRLDRTHRALAETIEAMRAKVAGL